MISRYKKFIEDLILERMINESTIYYSPDLRAIFNRLKSNEIAKELLNSEGKNLEPDTTFLHIDDTADACVTFISMKNAQKMIDAKFGRIDMETKANIGTSDSIWSEDNRDRNPSGVWSKSRNQIRLGKLINRFFPSKFTDKQIEEFVNLFKAAVDLTAAKIQIVDGKDIDKYYDYRSYKEKSGTLGASCMCQKFGTGIFTMYISNPEVCKLLILTEENRVVARALVWKLNSIEVREGFKSDGSPVPGEKIDAQYFMDRQYVMRDADVNKMRAFAVKEGWAFKAQNNHTNLETIVYKGRELKVNMTVQLKPVSPDNYDYKLYPYVDTFRRYNPSTGIMYNDSIKKGHDRQYLLESTGGSYTRIDNRVYSNHFDMKLTEDEAVFSEILHDWLPRNRVKEITIGNHRGLYPDNYNRLKFEEFIGQWAHEDDLAFSNAYQKWIFRGTHNGVKAIRAITKINPNTLQASVDWFRSNDENIIDSKELSVLPWYDIISKRDRMWRDCYIMKNLLIKNSQDNWIPEVLKMTVYKIIPKPRAAKISAKYLNEIDADALGYSIIADDSIITDQITYENIDIADCKEQLVKRLRYRINALRDTLSKEIKSSSELSDKNKMSQIFAKNQEKLKKYELRLSRYSKTRKTPSSVELRDFVKWAIEQFPGSKDDLITYDESQWRGLMDHFKKANKKPYPWEKAVVEPERREQTEGERDERRETEGERARRAAERGYGGWAPYDPEDRGPEWA